MNVQNYKYAIKQLLRAREDYKEVERQILDSIQISNSHWRKIKNLRIGSPRQIRANHLLIVSKILGVSVDDLMNEKVESLN